MRNIFLIQSVKTLALCWLLINTVIAGQWKPLCIEGSLCNVPYSGYFYNSPHVVGPLVTNEGILLLHTPFEIPVLDRSSGGLRHVFQLSTSGMTHVYPGEWFGHVSDANAIQSSSGRIFTFGLFRYFVWADLNSGIEELNWTGFTIPGLNNAAFTGPPIEIENVMYTGIRTSGGQAIYMSTDDGKTWNFSSANIRIGEDRFNLMANPENNALWAIHSEFFDLGSLWESIDHGSTWQQVDDGSFPAWAVRVIHDPENPLISYALTNNGLYVSLDRGVSWKVTSLAEPVHGLVFVERNEPLSRALVVGTDTGIKVSVDEAVSWLDMSQGLLEIPHTVTYGHGMLIATSDAGYFTCNTVDCAGLSQALPSEEETGIVDVIEFYNTDLDHYFITASESEAEGIDNGAAGPGWIRTGESFLGWSMGSTIEAANVCRFYGSVNPGPNSHFYTISTEECSFLMQLQETQPSTKPRWNFEGYAFSIMSVDPQDQTCLEDFIPVYRAYNNGFQQGKDSNHRYVTNQDLLIPLLDKGWTNEGVVFCSPTE